MVTLFLPIADASKQFNVSESTLRRAAKQLIANNSTNVRAIKIKNGYRYELSQEYLLQHYSFDQSKEGFDQSKEGFDQSKSGLDQSKSGLDQSKSGLDQSKEGFDQSKEGFDQSKSGLDQSKEGFDQSKSGLDQSKEGFDQSKSEFDQSKSEFDQSKSEFDQSKSEFDQLETDTLKYERNRLFEAHMVLLNEVGNLNMSLNKERDRYDRLSENYAQLQSQTNMLHAKQLQLIEQKQAPPSPMQASSQQGNNYGFVWFLVGLVFGLVVLGIIVVWA